MLKFFRLLLAIFFLTSFNILKAQNLSISGGNTFSVSLCDDAKVYAWGENSSGQLGRQAPTPGPPEVMGAAYAVGSVFSTPQRVYGDSYFNSITIKQVDAGSGSHIVALDCHQNVWAWGEGGCGQIGNNTGNVGSVPCASVPTSVPARVLCPVSTLVSSHCSGGYLSNIKYVSGGNETSFAITVDGYVLSWGGNDKGQLGDGTTTNQLRPVYVKTGPTTYLTNIVQIEGGDDCTYALDANGNVWSWGSNNNTALGNGNGTTNSSYATKVRIDTDNNGTADADLSGITQISAGDNHGLALDASGYVWTWGGDWGPGQLGQGYGYQSGGSHDFASRVVAVGNSTTVETYKTGPFLTGATYVAGGQASSAVVLSNGKVVTFGANGFFKGCASGAGSLWSGTLGNGGSANVATCGNTVGPNFGSEGPVYVQTSAGVDLTGITSVSDGDAWYFATATNGSTYGWGYNREGQLGMSNLTDKNYATAMTVASGCTVPQACPVADLGSDFEMCPGGPLATATLNAGAIGSTYLYTWAYKATAGGTYVNIAGKVNLPYTTNNATTGHLLNITQVGYYQVTITDTRATTSVNCGKCDPSIDEIIVTPVVATFQDPRDAPGTASTDSLTFCGISGLLKVQETGTASTFVGNRYAWYATATSVARLGFSTDEGTFSVADLTTSGAAYDATLKEYTFWVADSTKEIGTVGAKPAACSFTNDQKDKYSQRYVVYEDIDITSMTFAAFNDNGGGLPFTQTYYVTTAPDDPTKNSGTGGPGTFTTVPGTTVSVTFTSANLNQYVPVTITFSTPLHLTGSTTGTSYYFGLGGTANKVGNMIGCAGGLPSSDNLAGKIVDITKSYDYGNNPTTANFGAIYDVKFTKRAKYACDRLPVRIKEKCPACVKPTTVTISPTARTQNICAGSNLALTGAFTSSTASVKGGFNYTWFKGTTATTPLVGPSTTGTAYTISGATAASAGDYILRVEDGSAGTSACYLQDTVTVVVDAKIVSNTVSGSNAICPGATPTTLSGSVPTGGVTPVVYKWLSSSSTTGPWAAAGQTTKDFTFSATIAATTYYRRVVTSTGTCPFDTSAYVTVTVNPAPAAPVSPTITKNCGSTDVALGTAPAGVAYYWQTSATGTSTTDNAATKNFTAATTVYIRAQNTTTGCWSATATTAAVTINAVPAAPAAPVITKNCGSTDVALGTPGSGITYYWQTTSTGTSTGDAVATKNFTTATTVYINAQDNTSGCWSTTTTASVTINAVPVTPVAPTITKNCGSTDVALGTVPSGVTYNWESSATGTTVDVTVTKNFTTATTVYIRAKDNTSGCWSTATSAAVTINAIPATPTAITGASPACPSSSLTIGAAPAGITYYWQGTNATGTSTTLPATAAFTANTTGTYYVRAQDNTSGCWSAGSASIAITINALNAGKVGSDEPVCQGQTPTSLLSTSLASGGNGAGSYTYDWESSSNNVAFTSTGVSGSTATDYVFSGPITSTTYYRRKVTSGTCSNYSDTVKVTFQPLPGAAGAISGPVSVCEGTTGQVYSIAAVSDATSYTWSLPTVATGSSTTNSITVNYGTVTADGSYTITVTPKNSCGSGTSSNVTVQVTDNITPTVSIPTSGSSCAGSPINFVAAVSPSTIVVNKYEWYLKPNGGSASIVGSNSDTYSSGSFNDKDSVWVVVTATLTCATPGSNPATSNKGGVTITSQVQPVVDIVVVPGLTICAGTSVTFTAKNVQGGGTGPTYVWSLNGTAQPPSGDTYTSSTLNPNDVVSVVMTSNLACANPTTGTKSVTMNVTPNVAIGASISASTATTICEGNTVSLTATPSYSGEANPVYTWTLGSTTLSSSTATVTVPASMLLANGSPYTVQTKIHSNLTCVTGNDVSSNTVSIIVNANVIPTVAIVNPGQICKGSPASFTLTGISNEGTAPVYEWYVGSSGTVQGTGTSFNSSTLNNGDIVKVILTSNATCATPVKANAQTTANIFNIPSVTISPVNPVAICTGGSVVLKPTIVGGTASDVDTYEWFNGTSSMGTAGPVGPYAAYQTGDYSVTVSYKAGCTATSNVSHVEVVLPPSPTISGADAVFCEGGSVTYDIIPTYPGVSTYQWSKNGSPIAGATTPQLIVKEAGVYTVTEMNVCKKTTIGRTVTVTPKPNANAGDDIYIMEGETVQLNGSGGTSAATYTWTPSTGLSNANVANPVVTPTGHMVLTLTVSNAVNCDDDDEVEIFVEKPVFIPNAFTPNGDGNNDTWQIKNIENYPNCLIEVYNRWGNLVWTTEGYLKQWDGTEYKNGELLPVATYYYIFYPHGKVYKTPHKGDVTIVR